jgi:methanogenic corrinoid protein MtbC1
MKKPQDKLINYVADLEKMAVIAIVQERLGQGYNPFQILEACQEGVRIVGHRFEQGRYYIAGLIMAGEILRIVVEMLQPYLQEPTQNSTLETIVIGTVQGDIHDIGKNLVSMLLSCQSFRIIDLGVDVPAADFIAAIKEYKPKIVGLSCLLTTAFESMKSVIDSIETSDLRSGLSIIIGGSIIDEETCKFVGADYWTIDAQAGVQWCKTQLI